MTAAITSTENDGLRVTHLSERATGLEIAKALRSLRCGQIDSIVFPGHAKFERLAKDGPSDTGECNQATEYDDNYANNTVSPTVCREYPSALEGRNWWVVQPLAEAEDCGANPDQSKVALVEGKSPNSERNARCDHAFVPLVAVKDAGKITHFIHLIRRAVSNLAHGIFRRNRFR
ncbi:MAG: hypothetical protein H6R00_946 [Proteobacteria bacterium]|nr:hypothetical protein [Pseudomonadota bacterium]